LPPQPEQYAKQLPAHFGIVRCEVECSLQMRDG